MFDQNNSGFLSQRVQEHRQVYNKQLKEFQEKLREYEDWLTRVKIAHAGEPMVGYDVTYLRSQIRENQVSYYLTALSEIPPNLKSYQSI